MNYTDEQVEIINCKDNSIIVQALAGTGKTSTAVAFAKKRYDKKILYLVYNSSMKKEAEEAFKGLNNVDIKTTHGLAYGSYGYKYGNSKKLVNTNYRVLDVIKDLKLNKNDYDFANDILNFFNGYLLDDSFTIDEYAEKYFKRSGVVAKKIVNNVKKLWDLKSNISNGVKVEHDFYLKEYFISGFKTVNKYDILIIDELQDANTIIEYIYNNSQCEQKLGLGDSHQSLYSWRGATDIMQRLNGTILKLTNSFRIGVRSAEICNDLLLNIANEDINIKGVNDNQQTFLNTNNINTKDFKKSVVICRTNSLVFSNAMEAVLSGKSVYFEGGVRGYKFDFYKKLYFFNLGIPQKDELLGKFDNMIELLRYAEDTDDIEIMTAISIVRTYNVKIPNAVDTIKEFAMNKKENADVILTTVFKAKGMTYTVPVFIENDFAKISDLIEMKKAIEHMPKSEAEFMSVRFKEALNLIYVAITRAKDKLFVNKDIAEYVINEYNKNKI